MNDHNGLPHGSVRKESACNAGDTFDPPGFDPWVEDTLEEEMAPPSSIFAWKLPRREKPGGPQFIGSKGVEYSLATEHLQ